MTQYDEEYDKYENILSREENEKNNNNNNNTFYYNTATNIALEYVESAKNIIQNIDWVKMAETATQTAEVVAEKALAVTEIVGEVSNVAAKSLRSAIVFNGPEPLCTMIAMTDSSAFPRYIDKFPFHQRLKYYDNLKNQYPDRFPVVIEKAPGSRLKFENSCLKKFLVPHKTTLGSFIVIIRNAINIPVHESFWLIPAFDHSFILSPHNQFMSYFYNRYVSQDGFLYLHLREQNAFG
jgi:hypothetical protein